LFLRREHELPAFLKHEIYLTLKEQKENMFHNLHKIITNSEKKT